MEGQVTWGEAPLPSEVAQQLGWEGVKPQHLRAPCERRPVFISSEDYFRTQA